MRKALALCLLSAAFAAFAVATAPAQSVTYDLQGTFAGNAANSSLSAPGGRFDLQFTLSLTPDPASFEANSFDLAPSSLSFSLNGQAASLLGADLSFFTAGAQGGLTADLTDVQGTILNLNVTGAQLFTGTTRAPVLAAGPFGVSATASVTTGLFGNTTTPALNALTLVGTTPVPPPAPEPSSLAALLALGGAGLGAAARRARGFAGTRFRPA